MSDATQSLRNVPIGSPPRPPPPCQVCGKPADVAVPCKAINLAPIGKSPPRERLEFFCLEHFPR